MRTCCSKARRPSACGRTDTTGWAVTWNQMGHGNWATDPNYSDKVMKIYAGMVAYASSQ